MKIPTERQESITISGENLEDIVHGAYLVNILSSTGRMGDEVKVNQDRGAGLVLITLK